MDIEHLELALLLIVITTIGFWFGYRSDKPTELEKQKGCIVYNDKVYCEVSNIEKGE